MQKLLAVTAANMPATAKTVAFKIHKPRTHLVRRFVETGDERCPLAGLWTEIVLNDSAEEAERSWPAPRFLCLGRAFIFA